MAANLLLYFSDNQPRGPERLRGPTGGLPHRGEEWQAPPSPEAFPGFVCCHSVKLASKGECLSHLIDSPFVRNCSFVFHIFYPMKEFKLPLRKTQNMNIEF